jgi:hypothetical protein
VATEDQRWSIISAVIQLWAQAVPEVDFQDCWTVEGGPELVFPGEIEGTLDVPTMRADRHQRDDIFSVTWEIRAGLPAQTAAEARARFGEIAGALDSLFADASTLDDLNSIVQAGHPIVQRSFTAATDEGVITYGQIETTFHCRYQ